jgi:hypothetical protein
MLLLLPASMLLTDVGRFAIDVVTVASIGIFVPVIWYGVGWWVDDRRGRLPPALFTLPILLRKTLVAIGLILSLPAFVLGTVFLILGLALGETHQNQEMLMGIVGWSGWLTWISLTAKRRYQRLPK